MPINIGSRFDRYEIISLLGVGGMGEVYLAQDSRLNRKVALKILPALYTNDAERVRRFEKEAKSASALNHPNIITIHEVGQAITDSGNAHFIATEYIEGQTLRKKIRKSSLTVAETIEITIQIAAALEAAHSAGILHRDIKPENIMLRPDGYVKVLDFGLAKLTERGGSDPDSTPLPIEHETDPGLVLGTATYMSPEQARAQRLDVRTDIFSLGIVFYEMIAGHSPFQDQTATDVMAAILHREPQPLSNFSSEVTFDLDKISQKLLAKDREARFQTAKELQIALKNLRQRTAMQSAMSQPLHSTRRTRSENARPTGDPSPDVETLQTQVGLAGIDTGSVSAANHTSATVILSELKKHKGGVLAGLLLLVVAVAAIGFGVARWMTPETKEPTFKNAKFMRLTTSGRPTDAVISPDGKYVAYIADDGNQRSLWLRQVTATSNAIQIAPASDLRFRSPTFSHDGNYVFFVQRRSDSPTGDLYRVPTISGSTRKLLSGVSSPVALSPDDKQIAFVREMADSSALILANADGTNERELRRRKLPDSFSIEGPDWSPDGKTIVCPVANFTGGINQNVVAVQVSGNNENILLEQPWPNIGRVVWTEDGKGILMTAREPTGLGATGRQVWFVSYRQSGPGKATRVTNDLNDYRGVTISADGATIAAVQINQISNLWVAQLANGGSARQITLGSGSNDGVQGSAWTLDGKIIYSSNASGKPDLWKINADGTGAQQLTTDAGYNTFPAVSPNGRYIAFISDRSTSGGNIGIWRMDSDGGNLKQLSFGQLDLDPRFTPASDAVIFSSIKSGKRTLWKVSVDGGEPTQLLNALSEYPVVSPDGKWLACSYRDEKASAAAKFAVLPISVLLSGSESSPMAAFDIPTTPWRLVRWSPDSQSLTYAASVSGTSNIWSQPINGGSPKQLTSFGSNHIFGFDWSPDGKSLALARGLETREIVLISNFK